jgi:putative DNA primase/helicase
MGGEPLPPADRQRLREEIERQKAERETKQKADQAEAIKEARAYLATLPEATTDNPYLKRKGVAPCHGLLADGEDLICPVLGADGRPMSYQRITPDGSKRFAPGCPVAGGWFAFKGDGGPLVVCEGVATGGSLHQTTGATVLCSFSAGNLESVARMARARYPARTLILAADNDTETEARTGENPGLEAAKAAALAVNGLMAIPPAGDFNDLHQAEGLEAVKRIIEGAKPITSTATAAKQWNAPLPLDTNEKAEPYPLEALPEIIREAVDEVTRFVQCPVALTACSALAAISTVAAGLADCRRDGKLSGPIGLFLLALADSGERKTTVDKFFTKAIRQWEAEQEDANRPVMQAFHAAFDAWKAERDGLLTAIREASKRCKDTTELKDNLAELETMMPERPKSPQLLVGDATSEALTWRLAHKWPVGGLLSAEAGVVFGGHAMGRDSIMRNLATLNSLWDATPMSVERKTSECFTVRSARITVCLAAQPGTVRKWIENCQGLARESGFLARFLIAQPESTQGRRMFKEAPENWPALSRFHQRLADLLDHTLNFDDLGFLEPVILDLDPDAKAVWIKFHNTVEAELAPGGDMDEARDVASKASDNAARLAALFHVFEHGPVGVIGADLMERASKVVSWHLYEARRFLNQVAVKDSIADAIVLEKWLVEYCLRERLDVIPCNHIQKFGPNRTRRKPALEAALEELEGAGRIRRGTEGRKAVVILHPGIKEGKHGAS